MEHRKACEMSRQELERDAELLHMILEALPVNLFVKDTNCIYQVTSRVCDVVNGVERGQLAGKTDFDLQKSAEIAQSFYDDDQSIMKSKTGSRMLSPTLCGNAIKYYDIYKEPLIDENQQVRGIMGLVIDPGDSAHLSERAENGLNQNDEAFLNVDSFIFDFDLENDRLLLLKELERFSNLTAYAGKSGNEFINSGCIPKRFIPLIHEQIALIKSGSKQTVCLIQVTDREGTLRSCSLRLTTVLDPELKPVRAIGMLTEIPPENYQAEDIQLSYDNMQHQLHKIAAERFEAVLYLFAAYDHYQMISSSYPEISKSGNIRDLLSLIKLRIHPDDQQGFADLMQQCFSGKINWDSMELRMRKQDTYRWKELHLHAITGPDGHSTNYVATVSDIDDMVQIRNQKEIRQVNNQVIDVLSSLVESRDLESGNHIHRIKRVTEIFLKEIQRSYPEYDLDDEQIEIIVSASSMHDIGKIAIPDMVLLKPGKLTADEFELMKTHTTRGAEIINSASTIQDKRYYQYCYDICLHHHERYDGRGYPEQLSGDDISIAAQVVSIADVYDALVSKRCYKDAYSEEETIRMILEGECGCFNPKLLDCLQKSREKLKALYRQTMIKASNVPIPFPDKTDNSSPPAPSLRP